MFRSVYYPITPPYGMNGVVHDYPAGHNYDHYTGPLVNTVTHEAVDRSIPIAQRAAITAERKGWGEEDVCLETAAEHAGAAVVATEVVQPESIEAALVLATTPGAMEDAPVSPAPVGQPTTV